ncbi:hypothetical protein BB559_007426 [Furculomyces boomerangus]|uniref:O-phosphoseryl-tRNA(Sec) selenium transferase n=2 Tax=Harpellales TaxID=61421 RepID=A0A2T9XXG6_9FUNG|nr:hypothetical protein BB559_007426 [Furculomyces boomerangus]PVZ97740.1 hypothetical protein BB558_006295 [Smittium angustum]
MDDKNIVLLRKLLNNETYSNKGLESIRNRQNRLNSLLSQLYLPEQGWSDPDILWLLDIFSSMDMNNQCGQIGVGEREGRIANQLVSQRNYGFAHGIGRSGDIAENQPKAVGSSLLYKLANKLVLSSLRLAGASKKAASDCLIFPMATGMTLSLCLKYLAQKRKGSKYVIWPRIDQKSCFKAITTAGLIPIIIENIIQGDEIRTNIPAILENISELNPENIVCIYTTTSCFAPRVPDRIVDVAKICKDFNIPHLVNNAYGVQSSRCMGLISEASNQGRVDFFVQSTDKNYMVPVGGAIVASPNKQEITEISRFYPGRASSSPIIDVLITLLSLGSNGFKNLLSERKMNYIKMKQAILESSLINPIFLLNTPNNDISIAIGLKNNDNSSAKPNKFNEIGSMLYFRNVSGSRCVFPGNVNIIQGYEFKNWYQHINLYIPNDLDKSKISDGDLSFRTINRAKLLGSPISYLNVAVAIGFKENEIETFFRKLSGIFNSISQEQ